MQRHHSKKSTMHSYVRYVDYVVLKMYIVEEDHKCFFLFSLFHPYQFVTLHLLLSLINFNYPSSINHWLSHTHTHTWTQRWMNERAQRERVNKNVVNCLVHNYFQSWLNLVPSSPFPLEGVFKRQKGQTCLTVQWDEARHITDKTLWAQVLGTDSQSDESIYFW